MEQWLNNVLDALGFPTVIAIIVVGFINLISLIVKIQDSTQKAGMIIVGISRGISAAFRSLSWLYNSELFPVIAFSLALNLLGFAIRTAFPSIFFFDMVGTAAAALSCGPIWASIVALLTNAILFFIDSGDYSEYQFAFSHTNVTGALMWGSLAWAFGYRELVDRNEGRRLAIALVLMSFIASILISFSVLTVQLMENDITRFGVRIPDANMTAVLSIDYLSDFATAVWVNFASSSPDKIVSLLLGHIVAVYLFPVSWRTSSMERIGWGQRILLPYITFLALFLVLSGLFNFRSAQISSSFMAYDPSIWYALWSPLLIVQITLVLLSYFLAKERNSKFVYREWKEYAVFRRKYYGLIFSVEFKVLALSLFCISLVMFAVGHAPFLSHERVASLSVATLGNIIIILSGILGVCEISCQRSSEVARDERLTGNDG